ncbi:MAG TPA: sigma-70 family RNA polymerase sigma factor [Pyrinomonadaceae bacterium]
MPQNSDAPPESFDELLAWINPDRELAAATYLDIRRALVKIFRWYHCADPEGMTDETFERVTKQVHHLRETFEGDPKHFFYGVARNLIKEYQKTVKSYVSIDDVQLAGDPPQEVDEESSEMREECLSSCLQNLTTEKRDLILAYYAREKSAKIEQRIAVAEQLGVSIETLRVRMYRLRMALEQCIERCLDELERANETD